MGTRGGGLTALFALLMVALATLRAPAQTNFNSGSDGSYGAINITADTTLDLPPKGVFHCTTITVASGTTLRFNRNSLNTPVYLLATGDVTIFGTISVSGGSANGGLGGIGGPGGFDGGYGGYGGTGPATSGGDGKGPGAGRNLAGGFNDCPFRGGNYSYGNALTTPLIGGSGGAGVDGNPGGAGGGGGGAILVASSTRISVNGAIVTDGGSPVESGGAMTGGGGGSGGCIRVVAPVVSGTGTFSAVGAFYRCWFGSAFRADNGRVRIDCLDRFAFRSLVMPAYATRGSQMFVFPPFTNRLDFVQVGAQSIPVGSSNAVQIVLPPGPATNLTVIVRAAGFTNDVPIRVVVTPENGASASYDAVIPITANPAQTNVAVLIPNGTASTLNAWTR